MKMYRKTRRILALSLAALLAVTAVPTDSFADELTSVQTEVLDEMNEFAEFADSEFGDSEVSVLSDNQDLNESQEDAFEKDETENSEIESPESESPKMEEFGLEESGLEGSESVASETEELESNENESEEIESDENESDEIESEESNLDGETLLTDEEPEELVTGIIDGIEHHFKYVDNGDGTHSAMCMDGDCDFILENVEHEFDDGCCVCGAVLETEETNEPEDLFVDEGDKAYIYPSKIMLALSENSSAHAKVYVSDSDDGNLWDEEHMIELVPQTYMPDIEASVLTEEVEESLREYILLQVVTDEAYEMVPSEELILMKDADDADFPDNVYKYYLSTTDDALWELDEDTGAVKAEFELPEIEIGTKAIDYSLSAESEREDYLTSFGNALLSAQEVIDIESEITTATIEDELFIKTPIIRTVTQQIVEDEASVEEIVAGEASVMEAVGSETVSEEIAEVFEEIIQVDTTTTILMASSLKVSVGDNEKEITEPVYENGEYRIYKLLEAGSITDDVTVSISLSETEEVTREEATGEELALKGIMVPEEQITVNYDPNTLTIKARVGSQMVNAKSIIPGTRTDAVYVVPRGQVLTVITTPKANCKVTGGRVNGGKIISVNKNNELSITASGAEMNNLNILSEEMYVPTIILSKDNSKVIAGKKGYDVKCRESYSAYMVRGASGALVSLNSWTLKAGKVDYSSYVSMTGNKLTVPLKTLPTDAIAGKTLTLTMKYYDSKGNQMSSSINLITDYPATSVTLSGAKWVNDHYELSLPLGTSKTFDVATNNKGKVDVSKIKFTESGSGPYVSKTVPSLYSLEYYSSGNQFVINSFASDTAYNGQIKFCYDGVIIDDSKNVYYVVRETSTLAKSTPGVKVSAATDTAINLNLTLPKGFSSSTKNLYYLIDAEADLGKGATIAPEMKNKVTVLVPVSNIPSDNIYPLRVASDSVSEGYGSAQKYKVSVKLVQTRQTATVSDYANKICAIDGVRAESKVKTLSVSTQNPYYDTKITAKTVSNSIIQGETKTMAVFTNSAKTTFRDRFELVGIYCSYDGKNYYDASDYFRYDESELTRGKLVLTAQGIEYYPEYNKCSYKAVVKAYHRSDTKSTEYTYKFKVNPGIAYINVQSQADTVYKPSGKAATAKFNVLMYDKDGYYTVKVTKKNVKYEIVDANGYGVSNPSMNVAIKEAVLNKKIAVSDGKVTIAKDYYVEADESDSIFRLRVSANDYEGNTEYGLSNPVTIVSEAKKISKLIWVEAPSYGTISSIPAYNNGKKKIQMYIDNVHNIDNHIEGYLVAVDEDGNMLKDVQFSSTGQKFYIFSSSHDSNGYAYCHFNTYSCARGKYTIKASTNNGVNSTKSYTFEGTFANGLYSMGLEGLGAYIPQVSATSDSVTYNSNSLTPFWITCEPKYGADSATQLKVTGGKEVSHKVSNGTHRFLVVPTSSKTTVQVGHRVAGWYYSYWKYSWTYTVNNAALGGSYSYSTGDAYNVTSYESSVLTPPSDNTMYSGYSYNQSIKYKVAGGYSYSDGDYVGLYMDMTLDGVKHQANRKGIREGLWGYNDYSAYMRKCSISSDGTFTVSTSYNSLPAGIKEGSYTFPAVLYDSTGKAKSKPFDVTIKVKSTPKTIGDLSNKGKVFDYANQYVNIPWTKANANLSDFRILSMKNLNKNGIPTDFTKYFVLDSGTGKLKVKSGAPAVSKDTKVEGWIEYEYLAPSGWVYGEKNIAITVMP